MGARMQRMLDGEAGFFILMGMQIAIEKQRPDLPPLDAGIVPDDHFEQICLDLLITATERRLTETPEMQRRGAALSIIETAFRDEFPDVAFPPLHVPLVGYLTSAPYSLFGPNIRLCPMPSRSRRANKTLLHAL
jgi:hypothetical protein